MIKSIKHKGLKLLWEKNNTSKLPATQLPKIRLILTMLSNAKIIDDMNFTGSNLHPLKGELNGFWSVKVSGNYRIIFRFEDGDTFDIDYKDYH